MEIEEQHQFPSKGRKTSSRYENLSSIRIIK